VISIIVCTYNRAKSLRETLKSLAEMAVPSDTSWEVILVDNNSTDDTRAVIESFSRDAPIPVRYIFEPRQGKSLALNTGIREAKGEILLLTDDDVVVDPHWLSNVKGAFDRYGCAGVGGKIVPVWNCPKPSWLVTEGPYKLNAAIVGFDLGDEPCEITMKTLPFGANLALKKEVFERYGLFRTDVGPKGERWMVGEETEFCRRLLRGGEQLIYAPQSVVYHPVEQKRTQKRYFQRWYFGFGRSLMRIVGAPERAVRYFGVPRYLLPSLAQEVTKWLLTINSRKRFYYKLQVYQRMGEICEAYQMFKESTNA
jgi:glycosyltransferase involved in cell wall biosynthesis